MQRLNKKINLNVEIKLRKPPSFIPANNKIRVLGS